MLSAFIAPDGNYDWKRIAALGVGTAALVHTVFNRYSDNFSVFYKCFLVGLKQTALMRAAVGPEADPSKVAEILKSFRELCESLPSSSEYIITQVGIQVTRAANTHLIAGRHHIALPLFKDVLAMYIRCYPNKDSRYLAAAYHNVAITFEKLAQHQEAASHGNIAIELFRRALGVSQDDAELANALAATATALFELDRAADALPLQDECVEMRRRLVRKAKGGDSSSSDDMIVAGMLAIIAKTLVKLNRYEEGIHHYKEALAMQKRVLKGADDAEYATSLHQVGVVMEALGRAEEGSALKNDAANMRQRLASLQ